MHFQIPPYSHEKMVWCSKGSVMDVLLDIDKETTMGCQNL